MIKLKEKCGEIASKKYSTWHSISKFPVAVIMWSLEKNNVCSNYIHTISRESFQKNI